MKGYIGVTDGDWVRFLAATRATEVNFWQPSGGTRFRALKVGEPFLFKTHYRDDNRIVGGGFFEHFAVLRATEAWEFFGTANGAPDLATMIERVARYRRSAPEPDPLIGCVILNEVVFFDPVSAPRDPAPCPRTWSVGSHTGYPPRTRRSSAPSSCCSPGSPADCRIQRIHWHLT
ncbi:hypothetical protein [Microbacterium sp.]|uniref:hypothetical protein n=1 Tax=Microbacterium sp. TaxID=51671 RepID=UPI0027356C7A|nr:hypothetical protein [Microbacterium sp.]